MTTTSPAGNRFIMERYRDRLRRDSHQIGHRLGIAWADTCDALIEMLAGRDHRRAAAGLADETLEGLHPRSSGLGVREVREPAVRDRGDPSRRGLRLIRRRGQVQGHLERHRPRRGRGCGVRGSHNDRDEQQLRHERMRSLHRLPPRI